MRATGPAVGYSGADVESHDRTSSTRDAKQREGPATHTHVLEPAAVANCRLWEIDALRGLAIGAMVGFHAAWDWAYFNDASLGPGSAWVSGPIAASFITLLGVSISLDRDRSRAVGRSLALRALQRTALIAGASALVTLATWLVLPDRFVFFGILHLLAASTLLVSATARFGAVANALLGAAVLAVGWSGLFDGAAPATWLTVLGWSSPQATVDWYPPCPVGRLRLPRVRARAGLLSARSSQLLPPPLGTTDGAAAAHGQTLAPDLPDAPVGPVPRRLARRGRPSVVVAAAVPSSMRPRLRSPDRGRRGPRHPTGGSGHSIPDSGYTKV